MVDDVGAGVEPVDDHLPVGTGVGQVLDVEVVAVCARARVEDEVAVVLGGVGEVVAVGLVVVAEDELVLALRCSELVVVHAVKGVLGAELAAGGRRVAAVVEAVADPAGAGEFDPLEDVAGLLAGVEVHHADLLPVAASHIAHDHDMLVVIGGAGEAGGHRAVLAQGVGVEEDAILAVEAVANVPDALVLQAVVFADVVAVANLPRCADFLVVEDLLVPVSDRVAERDGVEVAAGDGVLGLNPCAGLFAAVVLQPAVGVGDLGAEVGVGDVFGAGVRIGEGHGVGGSGAGGPEQGGGQGEIQVAHVVNGAAN